MKVIEHLLKSICSAAVYNPDVQVAPACILWPDRDRQWEAIIPRLQVEIPDLFVLGEYNLKKTNRVCHMAAVCFSRGNIHPRGRLFRQGMPYERRSWINREPR